MEIRTLRTFLAVAETGSFTEAGRRVHVTQAAVSVQIKGLEEQLGTSVFTRANKKVYLTEAGEALVRRAERILREHDEALAEVAEMSGRGRGRLRLGTASTHIATHPLPEVLAELKRQ